MQTNDCVVELLGPGQINDLLFIYYGGLPTENLQDAEFRWLIAQGAAPANVNDMWMEFLGGVGALEDLQNAYW